MFTADPSSKFAPGAWCADSDRRLLAALPIAAAIVGEAPGGGFRLHAHNERFAGIFASAGERAAGLFDLGPIGGDLRAFFDGDPIDREFHCRAGDGLGARELSVKLASLGDVPRKEGGPGRGGGHRCLLSAIDRTAEVSGERNLRSEMLHDCLTGLANRLGFGEIVEAAMAAPGPAGDGGGEHAVLVVDMNRFSRVNESLGALAGDELLITFARRLLSTLRARDTLARTGGDEFAVLMALDAGMGDALAAADRITAAMSAPFRLSDMEIRVECAVGCALMRRGDADAAALLRNAQFAMKAAKRLGVPQVYRARDASAARRRFSMETDLRRAIERDELTLAFQPLIDLPSGRVAGYEALARWTHADRGEVSPVEFIPVAEESGLILSLGRWALDAAARTMADWDRAAGRVLPLYVGVNVSAIQIARDDLGSAVADALRAHGVGGDRLTIELTESAIVQDPARASRVLDALKGLNASVAMDDFGTGYSSLAYLQKLPIDVLKIDRSFVTGMLVDADSVAIVRAVLGLARALGMRTTAEGIETPELDRALAALGCSTGQGFHYARPMAAEAALRYWTERNGAAS